MHRTAFRTAVVAGACAAALSFTALPASAADPAADDADATSVSQQADDGTDALPDGATLVDDTDEADLDDDATDDSAADQDATPAATTTPKPAERGTPRQHVADSTISPAVLARKGVTVTVTGLTAGAAYQPYWSTSAAGDTIGDPRTADATGGLTYTWKPSAARAHPGTVEVGLAGEDTSLNIRRPVEVKYASGVRWNRAERSGGKVALSATVRRTGVSGKDATWRKAVVVFQKRVGARWVSVATDRSDAKGVAEVTVRSAAGTWRALVGPTATVFGAVTKGRRA